MLALVLAASLVVQGHEMHMPPPDSGAGWHPWVHGTLFLQYVHTFETRSAYQFGAVNRVMFGVSGPWGGGTLQARTMVSAEPLTLTERGAPQLFQVAFVADGKTITDHSHPSPWIMELAASYERPLTPTTTVSLYGAAIGEAALGPPVYMHRESAAANPTVPLGHHAQDVTHSSFGVVTLAAGGRRLRLEASAFNDREPEEPSSTVFFYDGAKLDSYAGRATVFAGSWRFMPFYGYLATASDGGGHSHGALHRAGVAILMQRADSSFLTAVYSVNDPVGSEPTAATVLVEWERHWGRDSRHVFYARAEYVQRTDEELDLVGSVSQLQDIEAYQVGYARAVPLLASLPARLGAHLTVSLPSPQLEPIYGGHTLLSFSAYGQVSISR